MIDGKWRVTVSRRSRSVIVTGSDTQTVRRAEAVRRICGR
jgi:hypothetical protein